MMQALVPGIDLGNFTLKKKIALGGMAEVWVATEQRASGGSREVALKVMLQQHSSTPHMVDMFWDEVSIARRLKHANIVRVYDSAEDKGHFFQVLELVDGVDVRRILRVVSQRSGIFPVPLALLIAKDMARALSYAHLRRTENGQPMNIVHRDISPHNVMVTRDGCAKVLDFGIAQAEERLSKTRTGVIKGKVAYMAPEQAMSTDIDARTDIFATGVVLWEMLAMERLFRGANDTETLRQLMAGNVPPVAEKNPEVPEDVAELVHHMLATHPNARPGSMSEVENRLNRALAINYEPDEVSASALAEWVAPIIGVRAEAARRKTAVFEPESLGRPSSVPTASASTEKDADNPNETLIDLKPPAFD